MQADIELAESNAEEIARGLYGCRLCVVFARFVSNASARARMTVRALFKCLHGEVSSGVLAVHQPDLRGVQVVRSRGQHHSAARGARCAVPPRAVTTRAAAVQEEEQAADVGATRRSWRWRRAARG